MVFVVVVVAGSGEEGRGGRGEGGDAFLYGKKTQFREYSGKSCLLHNTILREKNTRFLL